MNSTDLFLFESGIRPRHLSAHHRDSKGLVRTVFNGVTATSSIPSTKPATPPT